MTLSLGQAAVAVGMSKPTIQRAIKNSRLSASRNEDGSYSIDESELARVYPDQWRNRHVIGTLKQDETPSIPEVLRAEIEGLRQQVALLRDERDDLRGRLDTEAEERMTIQALQQHLVTVSSGHRASPWTVAVGHAVLWGLHHFESHPSAELFLLNAQAGAKLLFCPMQPLGRARCSRGLPPVGWPT